jgi:hypothetical protein
LLGVEALGATLACAAAFLAGFLFGVYSTIETIAREVRRRMDEKQKSGPPPEDSAADMQL